MATKKPLVVKPDEFNNLVFDENSADMLNGLIKNLTTLTRLCNYAKTVKESDSKLTKTQICKILNIEKTSDCTYNNIDTPDLISRSWFFYKMIENHKTEKVTSYNSEFDGSNIKKEHYSHQQSIMVNDLVFKYTASSILIQDQDKKYILTPLSSKFCDRIFPFCIICEKKHEDEIVKDIIEKTRKYNIYKNNYVEIGSGINIKTIDAKFDCDDLKETLPTLKREIDLINSFASKYEEFKKNQVDIKRGLLFYGIPGSGKTTLVKSIAKEFIENGGTVFYYTGDDHHNDKLSHVYNIASWCSPVIIILEDFDLYANSRNRTMNNTMGQNVNSNLLKMLEEGCKGENDIITIATTNLRDGLDDAAIRHGRIDSCYAFDYPDMKVKEKILKLHLKLYNIDIDFDDVLYSIRLCLNKQITGATIMSIVKSALQFSISESRKINIDDFKWACENINNIGKNDEDMIL